MESSYQEKQLKVIERKKKVVNDLLALRRMKYMEKLKEQRKRDLDLSFGDSNLRPSDSTTHQIIAKQAANLLSGTFIEQEALQLNGEETVEEIIDCYAQNRTDGFTEIGEKPVIYNLIQKRKEMLDENQKERYEKEMHLNDKKRKIASDFEKLKEESIKLEVKFTQQSIPSYEDKNELSNLISMTKSNLPALKQKVKVMKLSNQMKKRKPYIPPSINYAFSSTQQEQVNICTKIVNEIVENTLNYCFGPPEDIEASLIEMLLQSDNDQWEKNMTKGLKQDAILLIIQQLFIEMSDEIILDICEQNIYLKEMTKVLAADLVINSSELVGGNARRKAKDPKSKLVDQTWSEITTRRLKSRKNLWSHSQATITSTPKIVENVIASDKIKTQLPPQESVITEGDVEPMTYEYVPAKPCMLEDITDDDLKTYSRNEYKFWEELTPSTIPEPLVMNFGKTNGVSCVSVSYNHLYIAIGTYRGDIVIYNVNWQPFRPVRCVAFSGKHPDSITDIVWSLDASRIISLSISGNIFLWSVTFSPGNTLSDARLLGLSTDKHLKMDCQQLTGLVALTQSNKDFLFASGPLASSMKAEYVPAVVSFSPTLSFTASQNFIVIGYENGDIIRCDLREAINERCHEIFGTPEGSVEKLIISGSDLVNKDNKIGQNIECELYHSHHSPIVCLQFVGNNGNMISMDKNNTICIWEVSRDFLSGFNWLNPIKKVTLKDTEEVIMPKGDVHVVFEDIYALKTAKGKRAKSKTVIEKERRESWSEIKTLRLAQREPWDRDDKMLDKDDKESNTKKSGKHVTKIYAPLPEEIVDNDSDQTFHIVTKHKDKNILVKYCTQTYAPSSLKAKTFLDFEFSFDGKKMYFMFMYDKFGPNTKRHITFIDLNLDSFDMTLSTVIKYNISKEQFGIIQESPHNAHFAITKRFRVSGTDYIFANIAGHMYAFSLLSGGLVLESPVAKKFVHNNGLKLTTKTGNFLPRCKLCIINPNGLSLYCMLTPLPSKSSQTAKIGVLKFNETSVDVHRRELEKSYRRLLESSSAYDPTSENTHLKFEQTYMRETMTVRDLPVSVYVQMMVYSILDNAAAIGCGLRMGKEQRTKVWKDDWARMQENWLNKADSDN